MDDMDPINLRAQEEVETVSKKKRQERSFQEAEDFKWLMSDKRGRRLVWALLEKTGLHRNPFTGTSETFFRCGEMNVGQKYQALINLHCPERYEQMVKEHQSK